jgi:hypothetical protein
MKKKQELDLLLRRLPLSVINGDAKTAHEYKLWVTKALKARGDKDLSKFIGEYKAMNSKQGATQ